MFHYFSSDVGCLGFFPNLNRKESNVFDASYLSESFYMVNEGLVNLEPVTCSKTCAVY